MKITVLCVGKIKEDFYVKAINEYSKRLSRYCSLEIVEVQDEKTPDNASDALCTQIKEREGERILAKWDENAFTYILAINGKELASEDFSKHIDNTMTYGRSHIQFVIGGSLGLSDKVISKGDFKISFSKMTFPHQLMRVVLLEQVYRAFRIMKNEPYHK